MKKPRITRFWPWVAASLFWFGAIMQIRAIVVTGTAAGVSIVMWASSSLTLYGYAVFYTLHLDDQAKRHGVLVSVIGATLYALVALVAKAY